MLTSGHFPPGDPILRISVALTAEQRRLVGYRVLVDFTQLAFVRRNPQFVYNRVQTWKGSDAVGVVPTAELAQRLERELVRQMDQYLADHLTVNRVP